MCLRSCRSFAGAAHFYSLGSSQVHCYLQVGSGEAFSQTTASNLGIGDLPNKQLADWFQGFRGSDDSWLELAVQPHSILCCLGELACLLKAFGASCHLCMAMQAGFFCCVAVLVLPSQLSSAPAR